MSFILFKHDMIILNDNQNAVQISIIFKKLKIINVVITSENLQLIKSLSKIFMTSILNKLFISIFCERNNILFVFDILVKTLMEIITYKIKI